jgi:hypothetical protein
VTAIGEEFRRLRRAHAQRCAEHPEPWKESTPDELDIVRKALETEHPLRAVVAGGILPVRRASRLLELELSREEETR